MSLLWPYRGRALFREGPPLKLLVMSATLDGQAIAGLLDDAPLVTSQGREYPVETVYGGAYQLRDPLTPPVVASVQRALREQSGSLLVFLPGQREIKAVARALAAVVDDDILVSPLYGSMSLEHQQLAIDPAPEGTRKIVLATNVRRDQPDH